MEPSENNTVTLILDLENPPPLSDEQRARLTALAAMPDERIDYSDAPYEPDAVWMKAADRLPRPKSQVTLRLDPDVLDWFKSTGKRYQSRINSVLKAYVDAQGRRRGAPTMPETPPARAVKA
ncbi:MAG: BrnA antitoxin family protein [Candidatus Accumulibacter sp.]|jgi:uncharacterized protein (DUF4415 family)|nr:BrnA antitoxin family protein [Accumulibacter sp.]